MTVLPWHQDEFERICRSRDRMPHSLLIRGRRGTGKLMFALALARALLCESPSSQGGACGRCPSCGWMESGSHPDFRRIEPAGAADDEGSDTGTAPKKASLQIVIEQVRGLGELVNISSHRGGRRVVIIHPAEALNPNAANALLKNLEEPPDGVCFLLVTHRVHYLLPTMVSRCRQLTLPEPDSDAAAAWLRGQGMEEPGLALAQAGNSPLLALEYAAADYWRRREVLLREICGQTVDPLRVAELIRDYAVADVVGWLQKWTYDLFLMKCRDRVRYNPDYHDEIAALARHAPVVPVMRFHRETIRLQRVVHHPFNARLLFERLLIDYAALLQPTGPARS